MSLLGDILGTSREITPCPQPLALPGSLPTPPPCLLHGAIYPGSCGCALEAELAREVEGRSALFPGCWVSLRRNKWWLFCEAIQWAAFSQSCDLYPGRGQAHLLSLCICWRRSAVNRGRRPSLSLKAFGSHQGILHRALGCLVHWRLSNFSMEMDYLKLKNNLFSLIWLDLDDCQQLPMWLCRGEQVGCSLITHFFSFCAQRAQVSCSHLVTMSPVCRVTLITTICFLFTKD